MTPHFLTRTLERSASIFILVVAGLGDGGDAVTELYAVTVQPLRYFQRARMNFGVIGAMNGTFDGPRDDLLRAVILRRVFDDPVTKQRPVLHQSENTHFPPMVCLLPHDPRTLSADRG